MLKKKLTKAIDKIKQPITRRKKGEDSRNDSNTSSLSALESIRSEPVSEKERSRVTPDNYRNLAPTNGPTSGLPLRSSHTASDAQTKSPLQSVRSDFIYDVDGASKSPSEFQHPVQAILGPLQVKKKKKMSMKKDKKSTSSAQEDARVVRSSKEKANQVEPTSYDSSRFANASPMVNVDSSTPRRAPRSPSDQAVLNGSAIPQNATVNHLPPSAAQGNYPTNLQYNAQNNNKLDSLHLPKNTYIAINNLVEHDSVMSMGIWGSTSHSYLNASHLLDADSPFAVQRQGSDLVREHSIRRAIKKRQKYVGYHNEENYEEKDKKDLLRSANLVALAAKGSLVAAEDTTRTLQSCLDAIDQDILNIKVTIRDATANLDLLPNNEDIFDEISHNNAAYLQFITPSIDDIIGNENSNDNDNDNPVTNSNTNSLYYMSSVRSKPTAAHLDSYNRKEVQSQQHLSYNAHPHNSYQSTKIQSPFSTASSSAAAESTAALIAKQENAFSADLQIQEDIWTLETLVSQLKFADAVSLILDLKFRAPINDDSTCSLTELDNITKSLASFLSLMKDDDLHAIPSCLLLGQLGYLSEAELNLLYHFSKENTKILDKILKQRLSLSLDIATEQFIDRLCQARSSYNSLHPRNSNGDSRFLEWMAEEIDGFYKALIRPNIKANKLGNSIFKILSANSANGNHPQFIIHLFKVRISEKMKEDILDLLEREKQKLMSQINTTFQQDSRELIDSAVNVDDNALKITTLQESDLSDTINTKLCQISFTCRVLCMSLNDFVLSLPDIVRKEETYYKSIVQCILVALETFHHKCLSRVKPDHEETNRKDFIFICETFLPFISKLLENSLHYVVPELRIMASRYRALRDKQSVQCSIIGDVDIIDSSWPGSTSFDRTNSLDRAARALSKSTSKNGMNRPNQTSFGNIPTRNSGIKKAAKYSSQTEQNKNGNMTMNGMDENLALELLRMNLSKHRMGY